MSCTILEVSSTLIYDVYSTGITYDDHHITIVICLWYKRRKFLWDWHLRGDIDAVFPVLGYTDGPKMVGNK